MDFDKGWGRIRRCLLIVGIIGTIYASGAVFWTYKYENFIDDIILSWVPYFLAMAIFWIVKGFRGNDDDGVLVEGRGTGKTIGAEDLGKLETNQKNTARAIFDVKLAVGKLETEQKKTARALSAVKLTVYSKDRLQRLERIEERLHELDGDYTDTERKRKEREEGLE